MEGSGEAAAGVLKWAKMGIFAVTSDRRILLTGAAMIAATAFSHAAFAQDGGSYEAKGLPIGAFTAFPKVTATVEHNDNIYAQATNEVDDVIWRVQPEVTLESDWSRHSLSAFAKASFNRNKDFENENSDEYSLGADGRLDVLRTTRLFGGANYTDAVSYTHLTLPTSDLV